MMGVVFMESEIKKVSWRTSERICNRGTNKYTKTHVVSSTDKFKTACGLNIPTLKKLKGIEYGKAVHIDSYFAHINCKKCLKAIKEGKDK